MDDDKKDRRAKQRKISSDKRRELLAEYVAAPDDQPLTELHAAARLQKSRAWLQWRRGSGGGPKFYRSDTAQIRYIKRDIEAYLSASMTSYDNTSQYADAAREVAK